MQTFCFCFSFTLFCSAFCFNINTGWRQTVGYFIVVAAFITLTRNYHVGRRELIPQPLGHSCWKKDTFSLNVRVVHFENLVVFEYLIVQPLALRSAGGLPSKVRIQGPIAVLIPFIYLTKLHDILVTAFTEDIRILSWVTILTIPGELAYLLRHPVSSIVENCSSFEKIFRNQIAIVDWQICSANRLWICEVAEDSHHEGFRWSRHNVPLPLIGRLVPISFLLL